MSEWSERPFAEIANYHVGRTPSRANPEFWAPGDGAEPWVSIADMVQYGSVDTTKEAVSAKAMSQVFGGRLAPAGTLLMSFKLTIGRVATLGVPAVHNEAIISIYPRPGIDQRFLGYYLSQVDFSDSQDRQIKGNTLNKAKIDRIPVPAPDESEQRQVAAVLDLVRGAADIQASALADTETLKRAAMRELFTRGMRGGESQDSEIGPIPSDWSLKSVADVCDIWSGGTPRKGIDEFWRGEIPWASGKDLKRPTISDAIDHVSPAGVEAGSRLAPEGAVLLLVRGMGLAKDLPVAVITRPMAFNQDVKALVLKPEYADFTGQFIRSAIHAGKDRLLSQIVPSAHGTLTLNLNDVETMLLPWPPASEVAAQIVGLVDALDAKISLHRQRNALYEELFQALLHGLMSREIEVNDLDISALPALEVASA